MVVGYLVIYVTDCVTIDLETVELIVPVQSLSVRKVTGLTWVVFMGVQAVPKHSEVLVQVGFLDYTA